MLKFCCHTHWATVLVVNSNHLAQSNPQLCNLHPAERSQQDQVSTCYKGLLPRVKGTLVRLAGHAQEGQCRAGMRPAGAFRHMCFTPPILIHTRVWTSEIQIQIYCNIPCVTCMLFGRISSRLEIRMLNDFRMRQGYVGVINFETRGCESPSQLRWSS